MQRSYARRVVARAALVLALVAVGLSAWALVRSGGTSSGGTCGLISPSERTVTCTGTGKPPESFGACAPISRESGVMYWDCSKKP
jgi:hypothetical protein